MVLNGETVVALLDAWKVGDTRARDRLIERFHPQLRQIAAAIVRGQPGTSLSTRDLTNDAILRIMSIERISLESRAHFLALAARMMRNLLIDQLRARLADKRRHHKVEFATYIDGHQSFDLFELDSALIRLGCIDPQLMDLVEMRYFGGMTLGDIAQVSGASEATVKRRWQLARAWLTDALSTRLA
jgi:RNA polymerase sigma factor (TIGR02999 family)